MNENAKTLITRQVTLVALAENFFKKAALTDLELDANVLNEYRNCVRAQCDILKEIVGKGKVELSTAMLESLATANLAAKCVINDCVDILHAATKIAADKLVEKYPYPISSFYKDYFQVLEVTKEFDKIIPLTRGERRHERIEIYEKEFTEDKLKILHSFLTAVPEIENSMRLKAQEKQEQDDNRIDAKNDNWKRLALQTTIAIFLAVGGWFIGKNSTPTIPASGNTEALIKK